MHNQRKRAALARRVFTYIVFALHRVRATPAGTRANDAAILLDITTER